MANYQTPNLEARLDRIEAKLEQLETKLDEIWSRGKLDKVHIENIYDPIPRVVRGIVDMDDN